jgi:cytochrome d ubiquinol oxidase subunit I
MISETLVELSRWQFAATAMYHFLFVPLTIGLAFLLAIMESVYVMTGKAIYKDMTKFWGKLFGINFAMGVATGLTMEFQFGTNWAYYSQFVGDTFGAPLAIEGLMAFFMEATFVGLFFFGWERLTKVQHLAVTWLVALGTNFSALWILVANGWMNMPVGAVFNPDTMRAELTSFAAMFFNPVAQVKFVHTVAAGYVTGSVFVLGISAWYMLKGRNLAFARRSYVIAAGFGLAAILSVLTLGDESGYTVGEMQETKMAAIEAMWETEKPPASFTLIAFPDQETMTNEAAIHIPWVMGIIGTRSIDEEIIGIKEIVARNEHHIRDGLLSYQALEKMRAGDTSEAVKAAFDEHKKHIGHALLLKRYLVDIANATEADIQQAARDSIPPVALIFWTFRVMVAAGCWLLLLFVLVFYFGVRGNFERQRWLLWMAVVSLPLPWIAAEMGWIVAEVGRQPWAVYGVLPTFMGVSNLTVGDLIFSLTGFTLLYTVLLVVEIYLMVKYIRLGPASLGTGRYHGEQPRVIAGGGAPVIAPQPQKNVD